MQKFVYKFEKILKLKEFERKEKENEFSKIASRIQIIRNRINQNKHVLLHEKTVEYKDIYMRVLSKKYYDRLAKENDLYEEEITSMMDEYNEKKNAYLQAKQEEETYKKLKEKRLKKYKDQYFKEEQKFLDEISTSSYVRSYNG